MRRNRARSIRCGSSPRGRGTLYFAVQNAGRQRFIPARAGNTMAETALIKLPTVHPRAGGEHRLMRFLSLTTNGSSPRGRGTLQALQIFDRRIRFIPARAGNTRDELRCSRACSVHPRAGGEHLKKSNAANLEIGSSPRGRGTLLVLGRRTWRYRFIPARAGNTFEAGGMSAVTTVHPRAGGEHNLGDSAALPVAGSSPRGRGTLKESTWKRHTYRFIPARAGNTRSCRRETGR